MARIKYIHCFGTSHTAGGGFEFDSSLKERVELIKENYFIENEEQTQFNYSYPGQLQKFFGDSIKVINHAKQGYGNDRIMRIFYDIINEIRFNKDEHIFIFEFAGLGRREYYLNNLKEYCTINWQHQYQDSHPFKKSKVDYNNGATLTNIATSYYYESKESFDFLEENKNFFEKYVEYFVNWDVEFKRHTMENEFFVSYLSGLKFNFLYTAPPVLINSIQYSRTNEILFGDGTYFEKSNNFLDFAWKNNLTIKDETSGRYEELHNGFKSNKLTAHIIYNRICKDFNVGNLIDINWESYFNTNFIQKEN